MGSEYFPWKSNQRSRLEERLGGKHLLVQNTHDANATRLQSVEDDVLALLVPVEAWTNGVAGSSHSPFPDFPRGAETSLAGLEHTGVPATHPTSPV